MVITLWEQLSKAICGDKEDEMTVVIVSDSHPHGDQQHVGYSDIIGTVTEEDNSDENDWTKIEASEL